MAKAYYSDFTSEIELDIDELKEGIRYIEAYEDHFWIGLTKGLERVGELATDKVRERLIHYGLGDSLLMDNIYFEVVDMGIIVSINSEYAFYVEYGTGLVGESSPHPDGGWDYNTRGKGWWYISDARDKNSTKRVLPNGKLIAFTKGQPSRPFMYDTWKYTIRILTSTVQREIKKEIKKIKVG